MRFLPARDNRGQNLEIQMLAEGLRRRAADDHTQSIASVTGLQAELDAKPSIAQANRLVRFLAQ